MGHPLDGGHQPEAPRRCRRVGRRRGRRRRQPRSRPERRSSRSSGRSRGRTAPTTSCSPTRKWRRSTSRFPTRCTPSGRSARSRRASTCSARSRSAATSRTSSGRSLRPRRRGSVLSEAFMYRYHPQTARLVELVRSGAIGELRVIRSAFSYSLYDTDNIRLRTDVEGGALMDVGCYCVSGARLLAGEPESVAGVRVHRARAGPTGSSPGCCASRATWSRSSTAARRCPTATSSRPSARRGRCSSTTRGTATSR